MRYKPFILIILAGLAITSASFMRVWSTASIMVDDNPVRDRPVVLLIVALFFFSVIAGAIAHWRIVTKHPGYELDSRSTKHLAIIVAVISAFMAPLLSNDIISYMAYGELLSKGITAFTDGAALQQSVFFEYVGSCWRDSPTFYGPPLLFLFLLSVIIGGKTMIGSIIAFKVMALFFALLYIHFVFRYFRKFPPKTYNMPALLTLAPIIWIQGSGQAHADMIILTLLMMIIYLLRTDRVLLAVLPLAVVVACKFLYGAVLLPFYFLFLFIPGICCCSFPFLLKSKRRDGFSGCFSCRHFVTFTRYFWLFPLRIPCIPST